MGTTKSPIGKQTRYRRLPAIRPNNRVCKKTIITNHCTTKLINQTIDNHINNEIIRYSKELRLPVFRRDFKHIAHEAAKEKLDYEQYLLRLMEKEFEVRLENRKKSQIKQAGFPTKMYLGDLHRDQLPVDANEKLPLLERLDFITEGQNIVLAGNPGTGKNPYSNRTKT